MTRRPRALLWLLVLLSFALPATAHAEERHSIDESAILGSSPMCDGNSGLKLKAGGQANVNCQWSGSIAQPYPLAHYGLDQHTDADVTSLDAMVASVLQTVVQVVWQMLLYALRAALMLIELGFSHDLVNESMGQLQHGMAQIDAALGGTAWQLAALSVLGVWGLWNGLVRMKAIQTMGGLAVAVGLMIAAQVIMLKPQDTVGRIATLGTDSSLALLSAASTGTVDQPADSFAGASRQLFDILVVRPWCALQFADVDGCLKEQLGDKGKQLSIADVWLMFPANSDERDQLYDHRDGKDFDLKATPGECKWGLIGKIITNPYIPLISSWTTLAKSVCPSVVGTDEKPKKIKLKYDDAKAGVHTDASIQATDGVFTRIALIVLIGGAQVAAIGVLVWIGLRLLLAGLFALVLTLATPAVFFLAAFGEAGRAGAIAWAQRLLGLLVANAVFALMLDVVVFVSWIIDGLALSWFAIWLLHGAFWWGVLLRRDQLIGFLTIDKRSREGGLGLVGDGRGVNLSSLYYGWNMARGGLRAVGAPVRALRGHAARSAADGADRIAALRDQQDDASDRAARVDVDERTAETDAIRDHDRGDLAAEARQARDLHDQREVRRARDVLRRRRKAEQKLVANRGRQSAVAEQLGAPGLDAERRKRLQAKQARLRTRGDALAADVDAWKTDPDRTAETRWATDTLRRSKGTPRELSRREVDDYIERRREAIATRPPDDDRNLVAAGIDPDAYRRADWLERDALRERSRAAMDRSRGLIESAGGTGPLSREELDDEWDRVGNGWATRRADERLANRRRTGDGRVAQQRRDEARRERTRAREQRERNAQQRRDARSRRGMR